MDDTEYELNKSDFGGVSRTTQNTPMVVLEHGNPELDGRTLTDAWIKVMKGGEIVWTWTEKGKKHTK